jgi:hypothetical protein
MLLRDRTAAALCLLVLALPAPPSAAAALKPPKQLCVTWTSDVDANDTWEMNLLVRAVPGKLVARFSDLTPATLRFFEIHGMAGGGSLPGGLFPTLHGSGWMYGNGNFLVVTLLAGTDLGSLLFRGSLALGSGPAGLTRITPDGTATPGALAIETCSEVVIED